MYIDLNYISSVLYEKVTFDMFIKFLIVYFFIIWISILLWVIKDIWNRTNSILLQLFSVLIVLFWTPLWVFVYLLIRPSKTLFEKYYEEIDVNLDTFSQIIEEKNRFIDSNLKCFRCNISISPDFKFCPNCKTSLKKQCISCKKTLYSNWKICPYCWEDQKQEEIIENKKK